MVGTWRGLLVHVGHHGLDFAELAAVIRRALASVLIDAINASSAILKVGIVQPLK